MSNSSWDESSLIFVVRISIEVQIFVILLRNISNVNLVSFSFSQFFNVGSVTSQVTLSTVKFNLEITKTFILLFLGNDFFDSTCDDVARLNFSFNFFLLTGIHELTLWDYSNKSIFKTTYYFVVSDDLGNSSCHNNTYFKSSLRFIDQ